jgi:hypothetical protein
MRGENWNRCDECGRFIPYNDIATGSAKREFVVRQAMSSIDPCPEEYYTTLCRDHVRHRGRERDR